MGPKLKFPIRSIILLFMVAWTGCVYAQPMLPGDPAATPLTGLEIAAVASFAGTAYLVRRRRRNEK